MMDLLLTWKQILRMEVRPLPGTAQLLMDFSTLRPDLQQPLPNTLEMPKL